MLRANNIFRLIYVSAFLTLSSMGFTNEEGSCVCSPKQISKAFSMVNKKASPAVVFIKCEVPASEFEDPYFSSPFDSFGDDFLHRFFGIPPRGMQPKQAPQYSQGSGFLISSDGYIVTNAHVIKGAEKITIVFDNEKELDATLIGSDSHTDLAVLKVEGKNFPFVSFGNSDQIEVGEWVIAIGSPFQLESTLTVGVISAKGRQNLRITDLEDFIQTDAAINPGNSGGPLLNLDSEVIGINTAIVSRSGGYMGIGFAIPSNMAKNVVQQIIDTGSVTRGFMGISLQPVDKDIADAFNLEKAEGALVAEVVKDSPADKGGIKQGDIILEYNGNPIRSVGSFRNDISMMQPGSTVKFKVNRKGQIMMVNVILGNAADKAVASSTAMQKVGFEVDNISPSIAQQLGIPPSEEGVVITKIRPGSPAAMAGLRPGFLIQAVNQKKVSNVTDFNEAISQMGNKNRILLLVRQGSMARFYSIKLD